MDAFSYLSVLLSIIIGLAITQVLQGYRALLLARERLVLYAPTLIWSVLILVIATQMWWSSFGLINYRNWSFASFSVILLQTVLLYMLAALVLPDVAAGEGDELERHYHVERVPFFTMLLALLACSLVKDWMLQGHLPVGANLAFHVAFAGLALVALISANRRAHIAIALGMIAAMLAYIGLLFSHLN